jgi:RND family efflux transporter MFP subunit
LSPEINRHSRILAIEAEIENPDGLLRPGSFARVVIVLDSTARALVVPPEALVRFAGIDKVFAVEGGKAVEKRVKVGRTEETRVEILSGLAADEQVVLAPGSLRPGTSVRLSEP